MEAVEEGEQPNVLREIASDEELAQIPRELARKIHAHFTSKFDEFITAKAVFETGRKTLGKLERRSWNSYSNEYLYICMYMYVCVCVVC